MSKNVLFRDTVTIWNHYAKGREDAWQRTVLRGVQYHRTTEKTVTGDGKIAIADAVSATIPDGVDAGGREYLAPAAFKRLPAERKGGYWTLNAASNKDVMVLGESTREVGAGYTPAMLKADCADSYATIRSVADNRLRPRLRHWKVTAT